MLNLGDDAGDVKQSLDTEITDYSVICCIKIKLGNNLSALVLNMYYLCTRLQVLHRDMWVAILDPLGPEINRMMMKDP